MESKGERLLRSGKRMFYGNCDYLNGKEATMCIGFLDAPINPSKPRFYCFLNNILVFESKSYTWFKKRVSKIIVEKELTYWPEYN